MVQKHHRDATARCEERREKNAEERDRKGALTGLGKVPKTVERFKTERGEKCEKERKSAKTGAAKSAKKSGLVQKKRGEKVQKREEKCKKERKPAKKSGKVQKRTWRKVRKKRGQNCKKERHEECKKERKSAKMGVSGALVVKIAICVKKAAQWCGQCPRKMLKGVKYRSHAF